ncbi:MAG: hypothetical protein R2712_29210 [Vicinamibacterales bacterium]
MSTELQSLLRDFYLARLALLMRHEEVARQVSACDTNNACSHIIAREGHDVVAPARADGPAGADSGRPRAPVGGHGQGRRLEGALRRGRHGRPAVRGHTAAARRARHARAPQGHAEVILGEMLEHKRLFDQAAAGRSDLIGTHLPINERRGVVAATRWME